MSVKFTPATYCTSAFSVISMYSFYDNKSFLWGKCYRDKESNFVGVQSPVSCKDYIVDTYFNTVTSGYKEQAEFVLNKYDPSFYILCPNMELKQKILKHVKTHINKYEEKHGFKLTEAYDVECTCVRDANYNKYIICFEYDPMWMMNATAMSVYLSMIRTYIYSTQTTDFDTVKLDAVRDCNEYTYYSQLSTNQKHLISYLYNNPRLLCVDTTALGYEKSGFKKTT